MADDDAGEGRGFEEVFEPGDSQKIEMVRRFVQQKNVGMLNQSFNNGQTLLPSAGKFVGPGVKVLKSGTA